MTADADGYTEVETKRGTFSYKVVSDDHRRPPSQVDKAIVAELEKGKTVYITGATDKELLALYAYFNYRHRKFHRRFKKKGHAGNPTPGHALWLDPVEGDS